RDNAGMAASGPSADGPAAQAEGRWEDASAAFEAAPAGPAGLGPQNEATCWAVFIVTWVAAPAPSVTMPVTGWARPKFAQESSSNDPASRLARKVYRVSPAVGTGEGAAANRRSLAAMNGVWILIRF